MMEKQRRLKLVLNFVLRRTENDVGNDIGTGI